ncbi:MAG: hypothetical protein ACPHL6_01180 [Rubripirellula sp.]
MESSRETAKQRNSETAKQRNSGTAEQPSSYINNSHPKRNMVKVIKCDGVPAKTRQSWL